MPQPTMGDINTATPKSDAPLDLRTTEGEAAKAKAAEDLAQKRAVQEAVVVSPVGVDGFTPAPASSTMPIGAEAAQPPIKTITPAFALPTEPSKPVKESAPGAITTAGALGSTPTDTVAAPQATPDPGSVKPPKKPGLFAKLFGKK